MRPQVLPSIVVLAIVLMQCNCVGCFYHFRGASCKDRDAALGARVETLKRDARDKLTIGTKKDAVIRFFSEKAIPLTFIEGEATGTVRTLGCAPFFGCGTDDALLGLRVKVNDQGTVIGEPIVGAIYTNCL